MDEAMLAETLVIKINVKKNWNAEFSILNKECIDHGSRI